MKTLQFNSSLIGTRYTADFCLPDFVRDANGKIDAKKCIDVVLQNEYGYVETSGLTCQVTDVTDHNGDNWNGNLIAGKATHTKLQFVCTKDGKQSSFFVDLYLPVNVPKDCLKMAVYFGFNAKVPNKHCPLEEIIDMGFGIAYTNYNNVTEDNNDYCDGLSNLLIDRSLPYCAGKIAVWAYAESLIGNYLLTHYVNKGNLYVAGHSRLGKTSLLACALYDCFTGCFVNCSGCSGVAIHRQKQGEKIADLINLPYFWFTEKFKQYVGKDDQLPFDQHYLLGAICPRKAFIVTASEDIPADTDAQYLCAQAASVAYRENGLTGMEQIDIATDQVNDKGEIKFCKRKGNHYFSRQDWAFYITNAQKD